MEAAGSIDWDGQIQASLIWLAKAFGLSLIGIVVAFFLIRWLTRWGRQFLRITGPYLSPRTRPWLYPWMGAIVLATLFSVRLDVLLSYWNNGFYTAIQKLDAAAFWRMLAIFCGLATVSVAHALLNFYLSEAFVIRWRAWLTETATAQWLAHQGYYRDRYTDAPVDNPEQRIQEDINSFAANSLSLATGLLSAAVSLVAFSLILWNLSGPLTIFGVTVPRAMVFLVYLYVLAVTAVAVWVGRPLIALNFLSEKLNANLRYVLIRVREYGESIAFYRGERIEQATILARFSAVIANMWAIVYRALKFQGFNLAASQTAVVFPFLIQAPRMLARQITLGDVIQTSQAFGQVESALSFIRTSYGTFAAYRAVLDRLTGFMDSLEHVETLPSVTRRTAPAVFAVAHLTVRSPAGAPLISDLNFSLNPGDTLLIRGPSGIGKTTLLRAIAGLWPYAQGEVTQVVEERAMFLPQRPYLPLGSLRFALNFPRPLPANADLEEVLVRCQLRHLIGHLDQEDDWTTILSLGEQQRIAIARVLLQRPGLVFLDEATSALDEGLELDLYHLLLDQLPEAICVSVGHRSTLLPLHRWHLDLRPGGAWELARIEASSSPGEIRALST